LKINGAGISLCHPINAQQAKQRHLLRMLRMFCSLTEHASNAARMVNYSRSIVMAKRFGCIVNAKVLGGMVTRERTGKNRNGD
jgi:hypothetical protein